MTFSLLFSPIVSISSMQDPGSLSQSASWTNSLGDRLTDSEISRWRQSLVQTVFCGARRQVFIRPDGNGKKNVVN